MRRRAHHDRAMKHVLARRRRARAAAAAVLAIVPSVLLAASLTTPATQRRELPYLERLESHVPIARTHVDADMRAQRALLPQQRLDPVVTGDGAIGDLFGSSLAVDGTTLLVGQFTDVVNAPGARAGLVTGSVIVFERSGADWTRSARLVPFPGEAGEHFGIASALSGNFALIGARVTDASGPEDRGSAYVFERGPGGWVQVAQLLAPSPTLDDRCGAAVAISGSIAVVGCERYDGAAGVDAGRAFVYERIAGVWTQTADLFAPDGAAGDAFGTAVAIEGDTILVGAPGEEDGATTNRGAVYAFERPAATWMFAGKTTASIANAGARFGSALALTATRAAVGASADIVAAQAVGSAFVYTRSGSVLSAPQRVFPSDGASGDAFGRELALLGTTLLVGAPEHNSGEGAGYAFVDGGSGFQLQAKLQAPDGPFADVLGNAVALFGEEALLGAELDDIAPNRAQGSVARFVRSSTSWSATTRLQTGDGAAFERYGFALATSDAYVAVGAFLDDTVAAGDDAGSAYVYRRTATGWVLDAKVEADDAISEDRFGVSVLVRGDTLLVGSYFNVVDTALNQGAVYVFDRIGGTWQQTAKLSVADGLANDFFGFSLAFDGTTLLAGAPGVDVAGDEAGAAYVFVRNGATWTQPVRLLAPVNEGRSAGVSVALEGDTALLGAPDSDVGAVAFQGKAFAFRRGGGNWSLVQTITANDGAEGDRFGGAVALRNDLAAVGALEADAGPVADAGAVYTFTRNSGSLQPGPKLVAPGAATAAAFGIALDLDDQRVLVGAPGASGPGGETGQGRAYVFPRNGASFAAAQVIEAPDSKPLQFFGRSLALGFASAVVGAPEYQRDNPQEGAAYALRDDDRLMRDGFE